MARKLLKFIGLRAFVAASTAIIFQALALVSTSSAQTVAVQNGPERGHGWIFLDGGACYLILPRHLAEPLGRMRIRTAAPVAQATAVGRTPFWPGIDLAVATVDDRLKPRCTGSLDDLDLPDALLDVRTAQLERLSGAGEIERTTLTVGDRTYLTFNGVVPEGERVAEGTSGAFAFASGRPIGMAVTSDGDRRAQFVRAGEIRINVARWLEEHGRPFAAEATADPTEELDQAGLLIRFESASTPPVEPGYVGENLTQADGIYVTQPRGSIILLFRLGDGSTAVPLSQVMIDVPPGTGFAVPQDILIEFSAREDGKSMRIFHRGQMGLDGRFISDRQAPRNARWLRVRILSAWDPGPVAIGRVQAR